MLLIQHGATGRWLDFGGPREVVVAHALDEVRPALARVAAAVEGGRWAAGFLSYEAAPAFDAALVAHAPDGFPLLWFALYDEPPTVRDDLGPAPAAPPALDWQPTVGETEYRAAIARIKEEIARGNTYQVNYTLRLRAPFAGEGWPLFRQMIRAQRGATYSAYLELDGWRVCSASPELFIEWEGTRLRSKPMKGTAPRAPWPEADRERAAWLATSEKNRAENVMIVDMVRNDMGRVARLGSVHVPKLFDIEPYPTVWQMTSTVEAWSDAPLLEKLDALFPAASITGAPKASTMRIIRALEPTPRRLYTGSIGFLSPDGRGQFNVAIRTVILDRARGEAEYGVGGGIVWDSSDAAELEEARDKARILTHATPDFALLESLLWESDRSFPRLDAHLARLRASLEYFARPLDEGEVRRALDEATAALPAAPHKVRLLVDERGHARAEAAPLVPLPSPYRVALAAEPVSSADRFLYHKTTHRAAYERARASHPGVDDVILWNERGELTESTIATLILEIDGAWLTPPVASGLLGGVMRASLLAEGRLREATLTRDDLARASRLLLANAVRGVWEASVMV